MQIKTWHLALAKWKAVCSNEFDISDFRDSVPEFLAHLVPTFGKNQNLGDFFFSSEQRVLQR